METTTIITSTKHSDTEMLEKTVVTSYRIVSLDEKIKKAEERRNLILETEKQEKGFLADIEKARAMGLKTSAEKQEEEENNKEGL